MERSEEGGNGTMGGKKDKRTERMEGWEYGRKERRKVQKDVT